MGCDGLCQNIVKNRKSPVKSTISLMLQGLRQSAVLAQKEGFELHLFLVFSRLCGFLDNTFDNTLVKIGIQLFTHCIKMIVLEVGVNVLRHGDG